MPEEKRKKTRTGLKIISVVLSVLLWFYVVNQGAPSTGKNVVEAPLAYHNVPANLTVTGPETVMVRIWGAFQQAGPVAAYVDLSGLDMGDHKVSVHVQPVTGAMFTSVQPDKVKVRLDNIKEKSLRISTEVKENPQAGYQVVEISTSSDNCMVRGDQATVSRVASVVAPVQLGDVTDISTQKVGLQARDANGKSITEGIKLLPKTVDAYVVVEKRRNVKNIAVKAVFQGELPVGYRLTNVSVEPQEIAVLATEQVLENLVEIQTKGIDLKERTADFTELVDLSPPPGSTATPSRVIIKASIEQINNERLNIEEVVKP